MQQHRVDLSPSARLLASLGLPWRPPLRMRRHPSRRPREVPRQLLERIAYPSKRKREKSTSTNPGYWFLTHVMIFHFAACSRAQFTNARAENGGPGVDLISAREFFPGDVPTGMKYSWGVNQRGEKDSGCAKRCFSFECRTVKGGRPSGRKKTRPINKIPQPIFSRGALLCI